MTPSPQLENYLATGGMSGFNENAKAAADIANVRSEMAQRAALTQQAQEQTQGLSLENQIKQRTLRDQDALMKAWQGVDPASDLQTMQRGLLTGAIRNGASPDAVAKIQQHFVDLRTKTAEATDKEKANDIQRHDELAGILSTIAQAPPEQKPVLWNSYHPRIAGDVDPGEQVPTEYPGDQAAQVLAKVHTLYSKQLSQGLQQQQTAEALAKTNQSAAEAGLAAAKIPGETAKSKIEAASAAGLEKLTPEDWRQAVDNVFQGKQSDPQYSRLYHATRSGVDFALQNADRKGAQELIKDASNKLAATETAVATAKATQPIKIETAAATQAAGAAGATGGALDMMAEQALNGNFTSRNPALLAKVYGRASQLAQERGMTNQQVIMERNAAGANKAALTHLTGLQTNVEAFSQLAEKNMGILEKSMADVADLGAPVLNTPIRALASKFGGSTKVAALQASLVPVQNEIARVLNSANASGVLSDDARHEMQTALTPGATVGQLKAALDVFRQEMGNRREVYAAQVADLQGKTVVGNTGATGAPAKPAGGGMIRVKRKSDGATGTIKPEDFNEAKYEKL